MIAINSMDWSMWPWCQHAFPCVYVKGCPCVCPHHLLISITPARQSKTQYGEEGEGWGGVGWRQQEKSWLVREKLGVLKERSWKGNWREEIKAATWKVKGFFSTRGSGWEAERWRGRGIRRSQESLKMRNREDDSRGEGEDSCVFLMAQANIWVLSILNEYCAFSSFEFSK